jgi:hypothetical protein
MPSPSLHRQGHAALPASGERERDLSRPYQPLAANAVPWSYTDDHTLNALIAAGVDRPRAVAIASRFFTPETRIAIEISAYDTGVKGRAGQCIGDRIADCVVTKPDGSETVIEGRSTYGAGRRALLAGSGKTNKVAARPVRGSDQTGREGYRSLTGKDAGYLERIPVEERDRFIIENGVKVLIKPSHALYSEARPDCGEITPAKTPRGKRGAGSEERRAAKRAAKRAEWQAAQKRLEDGFIVQNNN